MGARSGPGGGNDNREAKTYSGKFMHQSDKEKTHLLLDARYAKRLRQIYQRRM